MSTLLMVEEIRRCTLLLKWDILLWPRYCSRAGRPSAKRTTMDTHRRTSLTRSGGTKRSTGRLFGSLNGTGASYEGLFSTAMARFLLGHSGDEVINVII